MSATLPYRIATLCYLFDAKGRVLLLHRRKPPNHDLYSPIGGKLDQTIGESPTACACREIQEETGLTVQPSQLHLTGIISESGYLGATHWLMFLYELTTPIELEPQEFAEGSLDWYTLEQINQLAIPQTDREIIWPLFWKYRHQFFSAHIDCNAEGILHWQLEQPASDVKP